MELEPSMKDIGNKPSMAGNTQLGSRSFHRLSQWIVPQRNKVHVAMFFTYNIHDTRRTYRLGTD